ncbi:MAG: SCO family protein [Bacteriovoracaceae bacterium]|nr:SCO family protein [Bacteriovoracaceae bacterium]
MSKESLKSFLAALTLVAVLLFSYQKINSESSFDPFSTELNSQDGKVFLKDLKKDKITLLYFGFLACPDVCPTTLSTMSSLFKNLSKEKLDKINFIFIGLDQERDSLDEMKTYVSHFHPKIIPVIVPIEMLESFARYFGVVFSKVPLKSQMGYTIDHSTQVVVLSPDGKILTPILHTYSKPLILSQVNQLLKDYFSL